MESSIMKKLYEIFIWDKDNKDKDIIVMKACPSCFRCFYGSNDVEMEKCGECREIK